MAYIYCSKCNKELWEFYSILETGHDKPENIKKLSEHVCKTKE